MSGLVVRPASRDEFAVAVEWAAVEGWNPGIDDLAAFHAVDPEGFIMGFVDGKPVSSVSVVRYGSDFGFLGFYIVRDGFRGAGHGLATWQAGLEHLQLRTVGLDGVVDQQDNYRRSGFVYHGRNLRYQGVPDRLPEMGEKHGIRPVHASDMAAIERLDRTVFPAERAAFLADWILAPTAPTRTSLVARADGQISGFGTIRQCRSGWKIGPLTAGRPAVASALFAALCATIPHGDPVVLDVPEANSAARALADAMGLSPVFETARMYLGTPRPVRPEWLYGITTFELG